MSHMKPAPEQPAPEGEPFERFDRLFRAVVKVPKAAVEEQEAKEREKNRRKRERRSAAKKKP
jgi:hypothetical protein